MNGFDYNKMAENFKADERLKMSVKNQAAGHSRVKFRLTKREKAMRYSSVALLVAYLLILCLILDVGETVRITTNTLKGKVPGAAPFAQTTSQSAGSKSSNGTSDTINQAEEKATEAISADMQKAEVQNTEVQKAESFNLEVQNLDTQALKSDVLKSYTYSATFGSETVKVNKLTDESPFAYYEFNTAQTGGYTIKTNIINRMFDSNPEVSMDKAGAVTFVNSKEKMILVDKIISYPKNTGETDSSYINRSINHIKAVCADDASFDAETGIGGDYTLGTFLNENTTVNESAWGTMIKSTYTGDKLGTTKTFTWVSIVFDKTQEAYAVQVITGSTDITNEEGMLIKKILDTLKYTKN